MAKPRWPLALLVAVVLGPGCRPSAQAPCTITGSVTLDDVALTRGHIIFEDSQTGPESGSIVEGRFQLSARAGSKRVRILASKLSSNAQNWLGQPARVSMIPARYNKETILTAEVIPGARNYFEFRLKSDPQPNP
jgi:hypothetical protein